MYDQIYAQAKENKKCCLLLFHKINWQIELKKKIHVIAL